MAVLMGMDVSIGMPTAIHPAMATGEHARPGAIPMGIAMATPLVMP